VWKLLCSIAACGVHPTRYTCSRRRRMINFLNSEVGCSEVLYASELVEKYYSSYFKVIIFLAISGYARSLRPRIWL